MAADDEKLGIFGILKRTVSEFLSDECTTMAAALSYYTIFSLPPLLVILMLVVGAVTDPQEVQRMLAGEFGTLMGPKGAAQIQAILANAERPDIAKPLAWAVGIALLIFGATGAFAQLQGSLNRAWGVKPDPKAGGLKTFLMKRVFSFGMVLGIAFLLLVSLVLSAIVSAFGDYLGHLLGGASSVLLQWLNVAISFAVITLLFALIFKVLPDAQVAWRDVWIGALVTALLFTVGKFLIGLYLGHSNPGEPFGAAGSLALVLVWIYYASIILLLGAEFTQVWADSRGAGLEPAKGAVRIERQEREVGGEEGEE
jgi:membrane protein